jgi:hypothetical protein
MGRDECYYLMSRALLHMQISNIKLLAYAAATGLICE